MSSTLPRADPPGPRGRSGLECARHPLRPARAARAARRSTRRPSRADPAPGTDTASSYKCAIATCSAAHTALGPNPREF
eukprot:2647489-Rhodomonas_salina.1